MRYHAPTGCFIIDPVAIKRACGSIRYAMQSIRKQAGLPLEPFSRPTGVMTDAEHAEMALLDLAENLGIDLGGKRPGQIDLREAP